MLMEQIDPRTHQPFYRGGVASTVISLAVHAPMGPPRNSYELLERINYDWLKGTYANDAQAQREVEAVLPHVDGVQLVMAGFFRGVAGGLDGTWAMDDADACYIGIDSVAHKEEAALMGRYLLEDAADYATARKQPDEQVFLIVDEFGGLRSTNATGLYEKVREAGMSVYAASQSYQSLGPERDHVLAASAIKIMHRSGDPRKVVEYAGEREKYSFSRLIGAGDEEDLLHPLANRVRDSQDQGHHTIMRPEKELAVRVEDVQQLELGQIAIISGGKGGFAQVHPLTLPDQLIRAAANFIASRPKFTPLAPPTLPPGATTQQQGHKKKIAASGGQPKKKGQQRAGPGTKAGQKPAAAASGQQNSSGKQTFPQTPAAQGTAQQAQTSGPSAQAGPRPAASQQPSSTGQQPPTSPQGTTSTTGAQSQGGPKKNDDQDDDVIDFNS